MMEMDCSHIHLVFFIHKKVKGVVRFQGNNLNPNAFLPLFIIIKYSKTSISCTQRTELYQYTVHILRQKCEIFINTHKANVLSCKAICCYCLSVDELP